MKKKKDYGIYDFSDYAEEITGEDLLKINGGANTGCNGGGPKPDPAPTPDPVTPKPKPTTPTNPTPTTTTNTPQSGNNGTKPGGSGPYTSDGSNTEIDNWTNYVPLQNQAAAKDYYERTTQRNEYYIKKYDINPYYPTEIKIKLIQKELDHDFALSVSSYLGTEYVLGSKSRDGIDCSGTITESLKDMGYKNVKDTSVSTMASGTTDWITILPYTSKNFAGNEGIINLYKLEGDKDFNHTNVGVGNSLNYPGEPVKRKEQIIDATSGDTMVVRNGNEGQYLTAGSKIVNQTYAPFSTREESYPVSQARINWNVLDEKYR